MDFLTKRAFVTVFDVVTFWITYDKRKVDDLAQSHIYSSKALTYPRITFSLGCLFSWQFFKVGFLKIFNQIWLEVGQYKFKCLQNCDSIEKNHVAKSLRLYLGLSGPVKIIILLHSESRKVTICKTFCMSCSNMQKKIVITPLSI